MSTYKLIHLVRNVGPTSMPWNDLYGTHLNINKFAAGFVFEITRKGKQGINKDVNTKLNFFRLRFFNAFFALMKIIIRSKRKKYVLIIHIHNMSLIPYALCLKLFGIKCILNVHNSLVNYNFYQRNLFNFGVKYFDSIIPVSECVGVEVIKKYPKLIHKVEPIRNIKRQAKAKDSFLCHSILCFDIITFLYLISSSFELVIDFKILILLIATSKNFNFLIFTKLS